jgi:GntR family transcriptional regulator, vanillate catabolism transcriptional regulator
MSKRIPNPGRLVTPGSRSGTSSLSVMDTIREGILSGDYASGERLNEVHLSTELKVSRTPIRAALQALAGEGLLDYAPNRGFTVRAFQLSEIVDAYDIRASLEGVAARFAAERGLSPAEKRIIETTLADGDKLFRRGAFKSGDLSAYRVINGTFHDAVLGATRNRMLAEMIRICHHVPISSSRNIVAFHFNDVRRRHDDHHRIYEAIVTREPWRAETLMREHVASIKASLIRSFQETDAENASGEEQVRPRAS